MASALLEPPTNGYLPESETPRQAPIAPLVVPPPAAPTTPARTPQDASAYEKFAMRKINQMGGQRMKGGDGKYGWVFKNGMTVEQAQASTLDAWNAMSESERQTEATASTPARLGSGGAVQAPSIAPKYGALLGNRAAPTPSATLQSGVSGDLGLIAQAQASPTGSASITPTDAAGAGPPQPGAVTKALVSPYGKGRATTGPRTTPSRINQSGTYDPNFTQPPAPGSIPNAPPPPSSPASPTPAPYQVPTLAVSPPSLTPPTGGLDVAGLRNTLDKIDSKNQAMTAVNASARAPIAGWRAQAEAAQPLADRAQVTGAALAKDLDTITGPGGSVDVTAIKKASVAVGNNDRLLNPDGAAPATPEEAAAKASKAWDSQLSFSNSQKLQQGNTAVLDKALAGMKKPVVRPPQLARR